MNTVKKSLPHCCLLSPSGISETMMQTATDYERNVFVWMATHDIPIQRAGEGFPQADRLAGSASLAMRHCARIASLKVDILIIDISVPFDESALAEAVSKARAARPELQVLMLHPGNLPVKLKMRRAFADKNIGIQVMAFDPPGVDPQTAGALFLKLDILAKAARSDSKARELAQKMKTGPLILYDNVKCPEHIVSWARDMPVEIRNVPLPGAMTAPRDDEIDEFLDYLPKRGGPDAESLRKPCADAWSASRALIDDMEKNGAMMAIVPDSALADFTLSMINAAEKKIIISKEMSPALIPALTSMITGRKAGLWLRPEYSDPLLCLCCAPDFAKKTMGQGGYKKFMSLMVRALDEPVSVDIAALIKKKKFDIIMATMEDSKNMILQNVSGIPGEFPGPALPDMPWASVSVKDAGAMYALASNLGIRVHIH